MNPEPTIDPNDLIARVESVLDTGQLLIEAINNVQEESAIIELMTRREQQLKALSLEQLDHFKLPSKLTQRLSALWDQDSDLNTLANQQKQTISEAIKLFRNNQSGIKAYQSISRQRP